MEYSPYDTDLNRNNVEQILIFKCLKQYCSDCMKIVSQLISFEKDLLAKNVGSEVNYIQLIRYIRYYRLTYI